MNKKKRGIYLIQEKGCLNPRSGAFQHIKMGLKHLGKDFSIIPFLGIKVLDISTIELSKPEKIDVTSPIEKKGNLIKGSLKDLLIIFKVLISVPGLYKRFKVVKPDFIYERESYLNFAGLITSKLLGIPHFYEANGLQYKSRVRYYKSFIPPLAKKIQKLQYKMSSHTFF
ncbi:glycosyltransferase, partial [Algibacter sp.]|nr:glycosyltransferase [Algibacter sp.]